jgi:hypothetical protein
MEASSQVPEAILKLVERYQFHQVMYKKGEYNETRLRRDSSILSLRPSDGMLIIQRATRNSTKKLHTKTRFEFGDPQNLSITPSGSGAPGNSLSKQKNRQLISRMTPVPLSRSADMPGMPASLSPS